MKPKNKTNYLQVVSNNQSLAFLALGILVVLLGVFIVWPKIQDINKARLNLESNEKYLEKLQTKLADLQSLNEFELTERHNLSIRAIPEIKNPLGTLISFRSLATEQGIEIEEISVTVGQISSESAVTKDGGLSKINFKIKVVGSKSSMLSFFKKIEESLPLITADNVKISLSGENAGSQFNLSSYYLSYPEILGKIDEPVKKLTADEEKILSQIKDFSYVPPTTFTPSEGRSDPFSF